MATRIRTIENLAAAVRRDPALANELKSDPAQVLQELAESAYRSDKLFYRIVVVGLLLVVLTALVFAGLASYKGKPLEPAIIAFGTTALGGIIGLLAPGKDG